MKLSKVILLLIIFLSPLLVVDKANAMFFGEEDVIAPIAEASYSGSSYEGMPDKIPKILGYHYKVHAFIIPYWISKEGYALVNSDIAFAKEYVSLGESLDEEIQKYFQINSDKPSIPWSFHKFYAYGFGFLFYIIIIIILLKKVIANFFKRDS